MADKKMRHAFDKFVEKIISRKFPCVVERNSYFCIYNPPKNQEIGLSSAPFISAVKQLSMLLKR